MKTGWRWWWESCLLIGMTGCRSPAPPAPPPARPPAERPPVSAAEASRPPETVSAPAALPAGDVSSRPGTMRFLVVHDAAGHPVYVELKQSSGDPGLDRRARLYVIEELRFPPGRTGTVTISLAPGEVPPPRPDLQP